MDKQYASDRESNPRCRADSPTRTTNSSLDRRSRVLLLYQRRFKTSSDRRNIQGVSRSVCNWYERRNYSIFRDEMGAKVGINFGQLSSDRAALEGCDPSGILNFIKMLELSRLPVPIY